MSRTLALIVVIALLGALSATACGGRSPLATNLYSDVEPDGTGGTGGIGGTGGTGGVGAQAGTGGVGAQAGTGGVGATGGTAGNGGTGGILPVECMTCMAQQCPEALDCFMNPDCLQGLMCVVMDCMSGGQPDFMCMLDCFNGNIDAAIQAGMAIMCVMQNCSEECASIIPFEP